MNKQQLFNNQIVTKQYLSAINNEWANIVWTTVNMMNDLKTAH